MTEPLYDEDPEPSERFPAGLLYVPFRPGPSGRTTLRLFRTPLGRRTAVGFTSRRRLVTTLGAEQAWLRVAAPALRADRTARCHHSHGGSAVHRPGSRA